MSSQKDIGLANRLPIVIIGLIASCIGIFAFCTGMNNVPQILNAFLGPNAPVVVLPSTAPRILPRAAPTRVLPTAALSEQIGAIKWELKDNATGSMSDKGNSNVFKKDILVEKGTLQNGKTFYDESIPLNASFSVAVRIVPTDNKSDLLGFGMLLKRRDIASTSWEWFTSQDGRTASKLQGSGQIEYVVGLVNGKWEISRTKFLSDMVFRAHRVDTPADWDNPPWLATIFADSYIDWPPRQIY